MTAPATPAQLRAAAAIVEVRGRLDLALPLIALAATLDPPTPEHDEHQEDTDD